MPKSSRLGTAKAHAAQTVPTSLSRSPRYWPTCSQSIFKTKNFHWHVSGPHFRDYHLLLDEQATQILATTDTIAERVRKLGSKTIKSIGHISRLQHIEDNNADEVAPRDMLRELLQDNQRLAEQLMKLHTLCDEQGDVASASLIETWIDEAEGRAWFLLEAVRPG